MHDKTLYVRSIKDNDIFLTVNGIRESGKMVAVGDECLGMGMSMRTIQISDVILCGLYALCHAWWVMTIFAVVMSNYDFLWLLELKMYQETWKRSLFFLKKKIYIWRFRISKTNDARPKRVSSLETCKLRNQLVIGEFGTSCTTFLIKTKY